MSVKNFWVQLHGGPPWGFRMKEEKEKAALVISRVNSKGRQQGLKEGDLVISVNGQSALEMTHAEAQRVIRESTQGVELQLERSTGINGTNGFNAETNGNMSSGQVTESRFNSLDEDANHVGSWSTDSTSTGSTTIHVSSLNSDGGMSPPDNVWSPSTRKKANLHLNLNNTNEPHVPTPSNSIASTNQSTSSTTVTRSVKMSSSSTKEVTSHQGDQDEKSPVWQPFGAPYDGPPQFRPVKLGVNRTSVTTTAKVHSEPPKKDEPVASAEVAKPESPKPSPKPKPSKETIELRTPTPTEKTPEVHTAEEDASLTHSSSATFTKTGWSSHLPPSQSPTITLLQKAREGQIPKGAVYIDEKSDSTPIPRNAVLIDQKVTVEGDKVHTDSYYAVPTLTTEVTTHEVKAPPKYDGIGPTEYGIPVGLRTGVKEEYASDWYKTMYKSLHRNKFPNDTNKTVHLGGYMSEPEYERKDKLREKYATEHRRKPEKTVTYTNHATSDHQSFDKSRLTADSTVVRHEPKREAYRVEPRSIADYEPGRSSLAEKEFEKQEHLGPVSPRPSQHGLNRRWPNVLLSDGYESDSTLIRKTGRNPEVDPDQQKAWYKEIQKGGEIPLTGLRKSVPEKPTASPHQYQETQVNIHYKSPIRHLEKEYIEEEELRKIQEDAMRKLYEEERRKKHQQEMAEIEMRRHSDFFTPSQKSPIPLNRYDNPFQSGYHSKTIPHGYNRGPAPKTMARTIYPFTSQSVRELSLNKGDIVYINKQIDKNWYEGEHHGLVGIFPVSYVEIIPTEKANLQPRKAIEGEALVKYNFPAQSPMELSLFKGERVILLRKLDHNWYEGRLGAKKGIFPVSYVQVLREPQEHAAKHRTTSPKPPSPIFSSIISESPPRAHEGPTYNTGLRPLQNKPPAHLEKSESKLLTQSLHIDTYNEPIPYRSLYSYRPQNDDELELKEGDTVYVMEKCDDGWYVGTSLRTGLFGTFPGNYVERM